MPKHNYDLKDQEDPEYIPLLPDYDHTVSKPEPIPQEWDLIGFVDPRQRINLNSPTRYRFNIDPFLGEDPEVSIQDIWRINISDDMLDFLTSFRQQDKQLQYLKYVAILKKLAADKVPPLKVTMNQKPSLYLHCASIEVEELVKAYFDHKQCIKYIPELSNHLFTGFTTLDAPNAIRAEYAWKMHSGIDPDSKEGKRVYPNLTTRLPTRIIHRICDSDLVLEFVEEVKKLRPNIDRVALLARAFDTIRFGPRAYLRDENEHDTSPIKGKAKYNRKERNIQRKKDRSKCPPKSKKPVNAVDIFRQLAPETSSCNQPDNSSWPKAEENKRALYAS
jgi:hypothetical protein